MKKVRFEMTGGPQDGRHSYGSDAPNERTLAQSRFLASGRDVEGKRFPVTAPVVDEDESAKLVYHIDEVTERIENVREVIVRAGYRGAQ